jgi:DNA-binding transcriptional ArsR family regulator
MIEYDQQAIARAAELFKALATPARISILLHLRETASVTELVERTGLTQPLVSQHLRVLRGAALVSVTRSGRGAIYTIADTHINHVLEDALAHSDEEIETPDPRDDTVALKAPASTGATESGMHQHESGDQP